MMKNVKMRNVETVAHTSFALKPFILYSITKKFGLIRSRRQVSREMQP